MAAAARTSLYALKLDDPLFDIANAARAGEPVWRTAGAERGARDAGRRLARRAVHRHRRGRRALRTHLSRSYPAITCSASNRTARQGRQGAPDPRWRRGARARSVRSPASAGQRRRRATAPETPRAAVLAALASPLHRDGAADARGHRSRCRGRSATGCNSCIHADVGTDYAASKRGVGRLRDYRRGRAHGGQPGRRRAAAAGHERRAIAAPVHSRRKPAARRLHAEARRRRGRPRRQRRAPDPRRCCRLRAASR